MKRTLFIIALGFIIGIIGGLYFNIVLFILLSLTFLLLIFTNNKNRFGIITKRDKFSIIKNKYIFYVIRICKILIKNNTIFLILISAFAGCIYIDFWNKKYEKIYNEFSSGEVIATIESRAKESEYKNSYKIKLENYNNTEYSNMYFILQVSKSKKIDLKYGDKIKFDGQYVIPEGSRNYKGFNYREYLKTQKVYGIFRTDEISIIKENNLSIIEIYSYRIKQKIIENIKEILPNDTEELFLGILIGYDDNLQENIEESFKKSSLTHLLAVSGAHIAYIIIALTYILKKLRIIKNVRNLLIILFLIFFMYITEFSSSVVRATIMGIISLIPTLIYRKHDIKTTIAFSLFIILIDNPYKLLDIGLILSYFATIGIILFSKMRMKQDKINSAKEKIKIYLKDLLLITLFANIFVMPIMAYNFNTVSLTFLISNLIAGIIIGPITIGGFILIIISFINVKIAFIIGIPYNLLLKFLINFTNVISKIQSSQVFISTPNVSFIILYYLILVFIFIYFFFKRYFRYRYIFKKLQQDVLKLKNIIKHNLKLIFILISIILISIFILKFIPKDFNIYFIDVGQGDSTLVVTPTNKKIMIDSGGADTGDFDIGESTLFPYLLDRGILSLDYICISHFDSDHCQAFIYLLNNIEIKNIIFSKQYESTHNFEEIIKIANKKKINLIKVKEGDTLQIDKYTKIQILHPGLSLDEDINNNSIVMKLECFDISMLFTGDISKSIEKQLVNKYSKYLQSDILKVAHHGSKTSSVEEFVKTVNPKIALIGVGKNNKFGHPNYEVIEILEKNNCKIYRTDCNGEIIFKINKNKRVKIDTHIK